MSAAFRSSHSRVHVLTQYVWPDSAVTALYSEQLADVILAQGLDTVLVGGVGCFRKSQRGKPRSHIIRLEHFCGKRNNLFQVAWEYHSVTNAFRNYIEHYVRKNDLVIMGSFPPNTTGLFPGISKRGAVGVYWLQDYYPDYFRSVWDYPRPVGRYLEARWDKHLASWHKVVKISDNLGYHGKNAVVIRNWPTLNLDSSRPFTLRSALYTGNLGLAHSVEHLVGACEALREEGFEIKFHADGHGVKKLPPWLKNRGMFNSEADLAGAMLDAEVHLVAADPRFQRSLFPSKFWNCRATGRKIICTGFEGAMAHELEQAKKSDYSTQLKKWVNLVVELLKRT